MLQKDLRCCGSGNTGNYHGYDCETLNYEPTLFHVLYSKFGHVKPKWKACQKPAA